MPNDVPTELVYIVEDDPAQRRSLAELIRANGLRAEEFASAEVFLGAVTSKPTHPPGCAVVDLRLPGLDGLGLQRALAVLGLPIPVVIVTAFATTPQTVEAMRLGAVDVLEKPVSAPQIVATIRQAISLSRISGVGLAERVEAEERIASLSAREREVLGLLVAGMANKMIAHRLGLSVRTVESYRGTMMEKLGAGNLAAAIRMAMLAGLAPPATDGRSGQI